LKIALDALFDLADAPFQLAFREVAIPRVDRLELGAVDGGDGADEEPQLTAKTNKPDADRPDRPAIVLPEVRDCLEVRRQPAGQSHQLNVAVRLALQPAARLDAVEVA
jgi:hypothetical protein